MFHPHKEPVLVVLTSFFNLLSFDLNIVNRQLLRFLTSEFRLWPSNAMSVVSSSTVSSKPTHTPAP
jgi:hypothetical protein